MITRNNIVLISILGFIFVTLSLYVLPINIHGDAFVHTIIAEKIAQEGNLVDNINKRWVSTEPVYAPLQYPETAHTLWGIFHEIGGENFLKLFAPISAALTGGLVFLLLKRYYPLAAILAALLAVFLNAQRYVMTPLIEPLLNLFFMLSIYLFYRYTEIRKNYFLFATYITIGLLMGTKLQGLFVGLVMLALISSIVLWQSFSWRTIFKLTFASLLSLTIAFSPLYDQHQRVGSLAFAKGKLNIPGFVPFDVEIEKLLFTSKFDVTNNDISNGLLGYQLRNQSFSTAYQRYTYLPLLYEGTPDVWEEFFSILALSILIIGTIQLTRKNPGVGILLSSILFFEIFATGYANQTVSQYHTIGIIALVIIQSVGSIHLLNKSLLQRNILVRTLCISLITVFLVNAYLQHQHHRVWAHEGRETSEQTALYQDMSAYLKENIPYDKVILNSSPMIAKYSGHDYIWNGAEAYLAFDTTDIDKSLRILNQHKIKYILINLEQTNRRGVFDALPKTGLIETIDTNPNFKLLHISSYPGQMDLKLYEVQ